MRGRTGSRRTLRVAEGRNRAALPRSHGRSESRPIRQFTIATGNGQSSLPTSRKARLPFFGSTGTLFFSRASAAKSAACFRSCANSPLKTTCSPPGPKMRARATTSNLSAASTNASAASYGGSKLLGPAVGGFVAAGDFLAVDCCARDETETHKHAQTTGTMIRRIRKRLTFPDVDVILCSYDFQSTVG